MGVAVGNISENYMGTSLWRVKLDILLSLILELSMLL